MITTNIIVNKPPFNGAIFKETIDLALVCAAFEHTINLIFIDKGVFSLLEHQNASLIDDKQQADIIKGLNFYDVDNILAEKESLDRFNISNDKLQTDCEVIPRKQLNRLNQDAQYVVFL
jgi:tRNA 2-thiouridine synthesizing protein C